MKRLFLFGAIIKFVLPWVAAVLTAMAYTTARSRLLDRLIVELEKVNGFQTE